MFGGPSLAPSPPTQPARQAAKPRQQKAPQQQQKVATWGAPVAPSSSSSSQQFSSHDVRSQRGAQRSQKPVGQSQQFSSRDVRSQRGRQQQQSRQQRQPRKQQQRQSGQSTFAVGMGAGLLGVTGKGGATSKVSKGTFKDDFSLVDASTNAFADLKAAFLAQAEQTASSQTAAYDKKTSFFDSISSAAGDRKEEVDTGTRMSFKQRKGIEEEVNLETFGVRALDTRSSDRRGRRRNGGGGNRGGQQRQQQQQQQQRGGARSSGQRSTQRSTQPSGQRYNGNQQRRDGGNQRRDGGNQQRRGGNQRRDGGNRRDNRGNSQRTNTRNQSKPKQKKAATGSDGWATVPKKKSSKRS